jgi:hypothetical protein
MIAHTGTPDQGDRGKGTPIQRVADLTPWPPLHTCGEGETGGEVKQNGEKGVTALAFYE